MKTAFYIAEGRTQVVLTPENDWEKRVVDAIAKRPADLTILRGSFYECQGGWTRNASDHDESLIMVLDGKDAA